MSKDPTIGMFVGDAEIERRKHKLRSTTNDANPLTKRPCGHEWRNNDFDCMDCIAERIKRLVNALTEILEGRFRYNMGDYETCAKNAARLALESENTND